jgi:glycosyltransferase involved in cell wall biosynthesis
VFFSKRSLLNIIGEFANLGHEVSLIIPRSKSVPKTDNSRVQIISIPTRHFPIISRIAYAMVLFFFIPVYVITIKPDYVIAEPDTSILGLVSLLPYSKLKRIKLILDIRSTPVETVGFRGFLQTFFFGTSVLIAKKFFSGITIITPFMKKEICTRFNINPKRVGVWSSGVSTTLFNPEKDTSKGFDLKRKLGLTGKFVVLYHGVFSANRGLIETLEAVSILKSANPDVLFFILGTGPLCSRLKELVNVKKLEKNVIVHDQVEYSEVPKYITMCNIGVVPLPDHPYWRFQSPLKLLEYLAMEKVVILTDIPAHRFVIGENKCGVYVPSTNPIEIVKAIEYVYHNKQKLDTWGKIGRQVVIKEYTWNKQAKNLENYLFSINS